MTHYTTKIEKTLSLDEARKQAKELANQTGKPQPVYKIEELETVQPDWVKGAWYYGENTTMSWIFRFGSAFKEEVVSNECVFVNGKVQSSALISTECIKGLATPEQIEAHLSAAAIKMGFKEGVTIITPAHKCKYVINSSEINYDIEKDNLAMGIYIIYNGKSENKWATILSDSEVVQEPAKNAPNPVLLTYRDEQGTLINIRATEVKINPLEGE